MRRAAAADEIRVQRESESMMPETDNLPRRPSVLLVYYTYTQQARRVAAAMAGVFRGGGGDVSLAKTALTDERGAERFPRLPLRRRGGDVRGMFPPQMRGATGKIEIPEEAR